MIIFNLILLIAISGMGYAVFRMCEQCMGLKQTVSNQWDHMQTLRKKAFYDAVTGLPNRALFDEQLERTFRDRKRNEGALFYIDVNEFKNVNDTYGHAVGDAALRKVAEILTSSIRPGDMVSRIGGDEFTILIKSKHNKRVADRIIKQFPISGIKVECGGKEYPIKIGVSIGAVRINQSVETVEELMRIGDGAMYRAKDICKSTKLINYQQWAGPVPMNTTTH